jgi:hypothetical protein
VAKIDRLIALVQRLRDAVEESDLHGKLTMSEWHVLCAAMDVLEDTQQAILAFSVNSAGKGKRSTGEKYLRTYGVLQALAVQQDAAKDLCDVISAAHLWDPTPVTHIRELRITSIGHPTLRRKAANRPQTSHFIVQVSLGDSGFELVSFDNVGQMNSQAVSIPDLAATQEAHLCATLENSLKYIVNKWPP